AGCQLSAALATATATAVLSWRLCSVGGSSSFVRPGLRPPLAARATSLTAQSSDNNNDNSNNNNINNNNNQNNNNHNNDNSESAAAASQGLDVGQVVGRWWNETYEFWDALEIWNAIPIQEDSDPAAVAVVQKTDIVMRLGKDKTKDERAADKELDAAAAALPGLMLAYYQMRFTRLFNKRAIKRGFSSTVVYANVALLFAFVRVIAPRLLAANNLDEFFDAAKSLGLPDRATLSGILDSVSAYDTSVKVGLYVLAFCLEKLFLLTEFLPIQIGLKTVAPIIFGGLVPGALASATCETLAALCNFFVGRTFLTERLRSLSFFGSPALGDASWFEALNRRSKDDGFRLSLLLRLAPILPLPFDATWYLLGALPVGTLEFTAAHWLGCLKTAFLDASFGMLLLTSVGLDDSEVKVKAQEIVLTETAAFGVVALLVSTVASKLINEMLDLDGEAAAENTATDNDNVQATTASASVTEADAAASLARRVD
ncbi:unnamed protein product, partial [Polarella glacialis]